MSILTSLFKNKRKKTIAGIPTSYNCLNQFNYENVVNNSQNSDTPLNGSELSDTLYLETEEKVKLDNFLFIAIGNSAPNIFLSINKRLELKDNGLLFSEKSNYERANIKMNFIELPENIDTNSTFKEGINWFNGHRDEITEKLRKISNRVNIAYLFSDKNGFAYGVISELITILESDGITSLPIVFLPPHANSTTLTEEVITLAFIQYLVNNSNTPFILVDENITVKLNANKSYDSLSLKIKDRIIHHIIDLSISSLLPSEFYKNDVSNYIRVFKGIKGLCAIFSFDIYDQKPSLSSLLDQYSHAISIDFEDEATRGYLCIQPGPEGLPVKEYKNFRHFFANKDVELTIIKKRANGSIVRGILSGIQIPSSLLDRFAILSNIELHILSEGEEKVITKLSSIDILFEETHFTVSMAQDDQ